MNKQAWLDGAELVDAWRVAPRLIVFIYLFMLHWLTVYFAVKFFGLPAAERTTQLTAFAMQCDMMAAQVGPQGTAPEFNQIRAILKSVKLPSACAF